MRRFLLMVMALFLMVSQSWAADQWDKAQPAGTASPSDIDALILVNNSALDRVKSNYRQGCAVSYATAATLTVGIGEISCSDSTGATRKWRQNTSATTVTWANIDTGAEANSTTYYLYAIADTDATTFTVSISISSTTPTGATYYKRLGSFYNDSSGNIDASKITNDNNYYALKLGDWVAKSVNVEYTASTDGTALGSVYKTTNVDGSVTIQTPTGTVRQRAGAYPNGNYDYATFNSPVKKGNTYKLVSSGTVTVDYYFWIPSE
jgi:hypothetical protein